MNDRYIQDAFKFNLIDIIEKVEVIEHGYRQKAIKITTAFATEK